MKRRDFLKGLLGGGATAALLPAVIPQQPKIADPEWHSQFEEHEGPGRPGWKIYSSTVSIPVSDDTRELVELLEKKREQAVMARTHEWERELFKPFARITNITVPD